MSTQTQLPILPEFQNQIENHRSLLDEPWKVVMLPEEPKLPPGVWPAPEPHEAKSLPWRVGDVTRLKDDSPKGMMEYIATHSTGWWKEMAERALRDTEKAERMAREQGWQPGQYWALEVDAEAKQKLLDAEEAKRVREEAARAKEEAEKEAFAKRQMELLKKAGRAPRCEYQYTDGRGCKSPQVRGEHWCHGHAKMMSYRPEKLEILPMEDEQAVMVNLYRVTNSLLAGRISEKVAGLTLWSIAIGMPGARKLSPQRTQRAQREKSLPLINTDHTDLKEAKKPNRTHCEPATRSHHTNCARGGHPGVTNGKSFVSGVRRGSTTTDRRDSRHPAHAGQERAVRGRHHQHRGHGESKTNHGGTETRRNPEWPRGTADVTSLKINSLSKGTVCPRSPY